jgi:carbonic anhydrase
VLKAKSSGAAKGDALLGAAVRVNVRRIVSRLRSSEEALLAQRAGKLKIVGARYDLDDGKVDFFFME